MTATPVDPSAPSSFDPREKKELFRETLAAVSRSFYLTLRFLPDAVQQPMALGYLLARLSDTVADSAAAPVVERIELLQQMEAVLKGDLGEGDLITRLRKLSVSVPDAGEQRLLEKAPALFLLYRGLDVEDRADVLWVLGVIIGGQRLDLERFSAAGEGRIVALRTAAELEDYTWRVAGCVGEFWTRVCFRHLPGYAVRDREAMIARGVSFGKALQLINILRDLPEDLRAGRCYLPVASPEQLAKQPELARPIVAEWEQQCEEWLRQGYDYLDALEPWRLRLAVFLPWAIARRTLSLMCERPPLEQAERVKISRQEVKRLLGWGLIVSIFPGALKRVAQRF